MMVLLLIFFPTYDNDSALFKFKAKIAGRIGDNRIKNGKTRVPLKYLSNFWIAVEMPLTDCKMSFILTWSARFFIIDALFTG